ncbi:MAG: guanylate cyclase [Leptospiraceae bacterium]|nr:guanylate cyclase [Leptospiraceae bacterium]
MSLFIILLLLSTLPLSALEPIRITEPEGKIVLGLHTEYMEDKDGKLRFGDVRKMETRCNDAIHDDKRKDAINRVSTDTTELCWNKSEQKNLNLGQTTSAYWIKFQLANKQDQNKNWLLEISYPFLDKIHLYSPDVTGDYSLEITGDQFPFSNRKIPNRYFIMKVPLHQEKVYTYYLRVESGGGSLIVPAVLYSPLNFAESEFLEILAQGFFYGTLIALFLYNLFLYFSIKDISYIFYLSYIASSILFTANFNGFGQAYFWSSQVWLNNKMVFISGGLIVISGSLFIMEYINTKKHALFIHKLYIAQIILSFATIINPFFFSYYITLRIFNIVGFTFGIFGIAVIIKTYKKSRATKYFTLAWSFLIFGILVIATRQTGFIQESFITKYSMQIGAVLEMILLSIGLGDKINILKEEKLQTQKDAIEEQKKLITSYARFVPEQLLTFLGKDIITKVGLGDSVQKDMTILFSDIRAFTSISETLSPSENFGFINSYLETMGPVIRKHNGFIDKYIGDAIMALFPQKTSDAIDASIEMLEELYKLNVKRKSKGFAPISIGIGIHTGSQMLGIIGEKERMEGTVISDVVNTASRLEGLTKAYSTALLVSEDVLEGVEDKSKYEYRFLDTVKVKGKNKAVRIFEILNGVSPRIRELKIQTKPDFEAGIELYYSKKFKDSLKKMKSVLKKDSKDKAAELYVERCNFYSKNGIDPNWDGVEKLDFK